MLYNPSFGHFYALILIINLCWI